jgi:AcrR family transcriptional regulator
MQPKNENLSRRQEKVLIALLQFPTIEAAAKNAGVNRTTVFRYLNDEAFHREYRKRRRQSFSAATALLNKAASVAVSELVKMILDTGTPATARVSAARAILQYSESGLDTEVTSFDANVLAEELEAEKNKFYE